MAPLDLSRLANRAGPLIPEGWEAHHQPVTNAAMTAQVELWSGADPEWSHGPDGEVRDLGTRVWHGRARVQQLNRADLDQAGAQQVTTHTYLVSLPASVETGAWVKVTESKDPLLGLMKVVDTLKGSLRWERDLLCTDNLG